MAVEPANSTSRDSFSLTIPADDAALTLSVQPLMQLQSSRKLNKALTRMLQHEQARSLRLELQLEAERKR